MSVACPAIYLECLDRGTPLDELAAAGASSDELTALEIVTAGRSLVDVTVSGDFGAVHFDGQGRDRDPLDQGVGVDGDDLLAVLYSDYSAAIQLSAWRGRMAPVREHGPLGMVIANSLGAHGYLALYETCGGDRECILDTFGAYSRHRARRAAALRRILP